MLYVVSLAGGLIFGFGLVLSGMINPAKVQNFLDITGQWDPTLALVFAGALSVAVPLYQWTLRNLETPVVGAEFDLPDNHAITPRLLGGSALFGIGWGLAGFCPGPGLTALATLAPGALVFVGFMFAGAALYRFVVAR